MKVWALFHYGYSYAAPYVDEAEAFDSLAACRDAFAYRLSGRDSYYPCTDESATASVYFADPRESHDPYPDRVLTVGPRGGIKENRA